MEIVRLLRLPGDHRALVTAEAAELGARMGEFKRLDAQADPPRPPVRWTASHSLGGEVSKVRDYFAG